ncbi:hypothetical protein NRF20_42555 [Streptomyces sp. R-74717]
MQALVDAANYTVCGEAEDPKGVPVYKLMVAALMASMMLLTEIPFLPAG